jgi:uncharacterized protein (DUF302 family)
MEMNKLIMLIFLVAGLFGSDIIIKSSDYSVNETVEHLKTIVIQKGMDVFTVVDHQKNAGQINMKLQPSKVIIFGNPKLGTALMQQDMTAGLDLPIRILVYEESDGEVKIAYRDGTWLKEHHAIDAPELVDTLNGALNKITTEAGVRK